jgi:aspartate-semialdehyde dehydrogenase
MKKKFNVAILGATGLVGKTAISILEERNFPIETLYPLASMRSKGTSIQFKGQALTVLDVADFDFSHADIAIFSAGADISIQYAPIAAKARCVVIDNTAAFRYDDEIPLVVPEVNSAEIARYRNRYIIANPNCSTIQLVVALKPIYDAVGIDEIYFTSYQSVSGAGKEGIDELLSQTQQFYTHDTFESAIFSTQIAFNLIPFIDVLSEDDFSKEEMKVVWETRKILGDNRLKINPTAVRVPVLYGHSEAVSLRTQKPISVSDARALLASADGVCLIDDPKTLSFPTPVFQGQGTDDVYVGRVRKNLCSDNGLNLWIVADNVRKGAALNAVQIAEKLITFEEL